MDNPMSVMSIVVNASPLRYSEYALDAARNAADHPADYATHDSSNRTRPIIALRSPFLRASNNPLSVCCQGHGKNRERQ
jgi:hypothetical protein